MQIRFITAMCLVLCVHSAHGQPLIEFKSKELQEGRNYTNRITAMLAVGESGGEVSYSYPIDLAPGRGVTPQVSLVYSSQGGQSPYGWGWELTVPMIERATRFGVDYGTGTTAHYAYRNGHDSHELTYIGLASDGRQEFHEINETSFSRYLFDPSKNTWSILRPDGTRIDAGSSATFRQGPNTSVASGTAVWLPYRIYDTHTNYAEYVWSAGPDGNARINLIKYDGNTARRQAPNMQVSFAWTTHWGTGQAVPVSYRGGYRQAFGQDRLATITVTAAQIAMGSSPAQVPSSSPTTRSYVLTYQAASGVVYNNMFYLRQVALSGFPPLLFSYSDPWAATTAEHQHTINPFSDGFPNLLTHISIDQGGTGVSRTDMLPADLNSDSVLDFIDMSSGAPYVWLGFGSKTPWPTLTSQIGVGNAGHDRFARDIGLWKPGHSRCG